MRAELATGEREGAGRGGRALRALLVDPSLFTAPYDAALTRGLAAAGVEAHWAARRLRAHEEPELDPARVAPLFYPFTERGGRQRDWRLVKGVEHALGLARLVRRARGYDVVHLQWAMLPLLDARAVRAMPCPVVLTVHDTQPFNGKAMSRLRTLGTRALLDAAARVIVHTEGARDTLAAGGLAANRIAVVPHGLLPLARHAAPAQRSARSARWRVLLFGRIQSYKGADVLVEALGLLAPAERARLEVVVAGLPAIDLAPLAARAAALGLDEAVLRFDPRHFAADEMAACLAAADAFVLPYRAIEASGVLFTVAGLGKWIVASDLGAFRDLIGHDGTAGALVPPGDPRALADALLASIGRTPAADAGGRAADWPAIGAATRAVYEAALA